jgi:DNA replication protein DnaD
MRNAKLERAIIKIDNEIAAMNIAKKYLSNVEEINVVRDTLNKKRQLLADELYTEDKKCYEQCCEVIEEILDKELGQEEQIELLETIKEKFGRQAPNVSKKSSGLNAWLKELCIDYNWIKNEETDWDTLVVTGFSLYE